jgi:peptide/nickel transport system substrate-binding protein
MSDIAQGAISAAQVSAQQATKAGVDVHLNQVNVTEFFGSNYLQWSFAQDYWYYGPYLPQVGQETLPTAQFSETHFDNPTYIGSIRRPYPPRAHLGRQSWRMRCSGLTTTREG